jgi:Fic family protein
VAPVRLRPESPYCARIRAMWADMRPHVVRVWDVAEQRRVSARKYLSEAQLRYVADAYHSLSIEGYQVSAELIERVRSGDWLSGSDEHGQHDRNTLAARGYHEAHLAVRKSLQDVLAGQSAGDTLRRDLSSWYRALWAPSVRAGLLAPQDLAGWRSQQVFIKNARHVPLPPDAVRDAMPLLFELLADEPLPAVRAVLGHFVFVFIHPYMDGNGRLARFIMNLMLSQGGWPWTVVSLDLRDDYMQALEAASSGQDIKPFARLISRLVQDQLVKPPQR